MDEISIRSAGVDPERLRYHLGVPYVAVVESVEQPDGSWLRRAEYPELDGCAVEAESAVEALERLDLARRQTIVEALARGEEPPVPRPPLASGVSGLDGLTVEGAMASLSTPEADD